MNRSLDHNRVRLISFEFAPFAGGHGTYATEIARALAEAGVPLDALVPDYPEQAAEPEAFPVTRELGHQRLDFAALMTIRRWLGPSFRDEVVLCCDIRSALIVSALSFLRPTRMVAMFHGSEILKAQTSGVMKRLCRFIAMRATALVSNSEYTAGLVTAATGRPCAAALLGVSDYWRQPPSEQPFEDAFLRAVPDAIPIICQVGRLERRKGQLDAITALSALASASEPPDFTYVVVGAPIDPDYTREVEAALGALGGRGAYLGRISLEDLRKLYARSRCLVLPARAEPGSIEGFGLVTVEAAAQGCPSVVTQVGGLPEAVREGRFGLVTPEADAVALQAALVSILTDPSLRAELSENGRRYAREASWLKTIAHTPLLNDITQAARA